MTNRINKIITRLETEGLDSLLVTKMENVRYLSGFSGSSAVLLIKPGGALLITDGRYREQASLECTGVTIEIYTTDMVAAIAGSMQGVNTVFERSIPYDLYLRVADAIPPEMSFVPSGIKVEDLRTVKEPGEIELMKKAASCAAEGFNHIRPLIKPGVKERDIAAELDYRMVLAGADRPAFDTIVASGPNSSRPHAGVTDRMLEVGDLVVIDFGAEVQGYMSDTTRTIAIPPVGKEKEKAVEAVGIALSKAFEAIVPGIKASTVDRTARSYLEDKGYGDLFPHSLGHGIGLEPHEKPAIAARSTETLESGMVFTIEPGIYLEGRFGVRLEELVLLTDNDCEILTKDVGI